MRRSCPRDQLPPGTASSTACLRSSPGSRRHLPPRRRSWSSCRMVGRSLPAAAQDSEPAGTRRWKRRGVGALTLVEDGADGAALRGVDLWAAGRDDGGRSGELDKGSGEPPGEPQRHACRPPGYSSSCSVIGLSRCCSRLGRVAHLDRCRRNPIVGVLRRAVAVHTNVARARPDQHAARQLPVRVLVHQRVLRDHHVAQTDAALVPRPHPDQDADAAGVRERVAHDLPADALEVDVAAVVEGVVAHNRAAVAEPVDLSHRADGAGSKRVAGRHPVQPNRPRPLRVLPRCQCQLRRQAVDAGAVGLAHEVLKRLRRVRKRQIRRLRALADRGDGRHEHRFGLRRLSGPHGAPRGALHAVHAEGVADNRPAEHVQLLIPSEQLPCSHGRACSGGCCRASHRWLLPSE